MPSLEYDGGSVLKYSAAGFITLLAHALVAPSSGAQDLDAMLRWTSAEIVHYDVVAEYSGVTVILLTSGSPLTGYRTQVRDRYEISFDWNPTEMELVGKPLFKNSPATLPAGTPGDEMLGKKCPPPKVNGSYDHVEVVGAKAGPPGSNSLELSLKRSYPAGEVPHADQTTPCNNWLMAAAKNETTTDGLNVPLGMLLASPGAAGGNLTVGKDGKTITLSDKPNGWTYTYTLRIVK